MAEGANAVETGRCTGAGGSRWYPTRVLAASPPAALAVWQGLLRRLRPTVVAVRSRLPGLQGSGAWPCRNRRTIRRAVLQDRVMDGLRCQLMQPDLVEEFIVAFNQEWRRLAGEAKARAAAHQRERVSLDRKIANLIEAISDGRSSPAIMAKLAEL